MGWARFSPPHEGLASLAKSGWAGERGSECPGMSGFLSRVGVECVACVDVCVC